jgi:surface polysaccharide O-acyltransferase-like enzyme
MTGINYLAVLVAAILTMALGALWYAPMVFGKAWAALVGISPEVAQKRMAGMRRAYSLTFVSSFVMAYVLARLLWYANIESAGGGMLIGVLAWLGFVATTQGITFLFEGRPFRLYVIDTGYPLVALAIMGALLAVWR